MYGRLGGMGNSLVDLRPSSISRRPSGKTKVGWLVAIAVIAASSIALLVLIPAQKKPNGAATHDLDKTVAVLPFENRSGAEDDYFSDGISANLIAGLARLREVKVIGRNSSFQFRKHDGDDKSIGAKLGATCLLEGSVRRTSDGLKISAKLIDAADESTVWSENFDREPKDIFDIEASILQAVATNLHTASPDVSQLTPWRPSNGNLLAYDALLHGDHHARLATEADYRKAIEYYDKAVALDPNYAAAFAGLGFTWESLGAEHLGADALKDAFARSEAAARKALELAPRLVLAHISLGLVNQDAKSDFPAAETQFRRAAELEPSDAAAASSLAVMIASTGRLSEAVELTHRALTLDPLRAGMYNFLSQVLVPLRRYEEAEQAIRKAMELQPNSDIFYTELALIEFFRGNRDAALQSAQKESDGFWRKYTFALLYALEEDHTAADAALEELIDKYADIGPFQIADVYAARKEPDAAFKWLDRAYEGHDAGITQLLYSPFLIAYRNDARFTAFCKKVGLPTS